MLALEDVGYYKKNSVPDQGYFFIVGLLIRDPKDSQNNVGYYHNYLLPTISTWRDSFAEATTEKPVLD